MEKRFMPDLALRFSEGSVVKLAEHLRGHVDGHDQS
jgi:hypothetical protein